jgi:hypothetical protein
MFLEKLNVSDSLMFLMATREALNGIVELSALSLADKERTRNFLINEATDYQILGLLVNENIPEEKFDAIEEHYLFEQLKEQMLLNWESVSQFVDPESFASFLCEIGPVYPICSSSGPVMEFMNEVGSHNLVELKVTDVAAKLFRTQKNVRSAVVNSAVVKAIKADIGKGAQGGALDRLIKKTVKNTVKKVTDPVAATAKKVSDKVKIDWAQSMRKTDPKMQRMIAQKGGVGAGGYEGGFGKMSKVIAKSKEKVPEGWLNKTIASIKGKYPGATQQAQALVQQAKEFAGTKEGKGAAVIGAVALASLAIYGGYKTYKKVFGQAAKACRGTGAEKKKCIADYKRKALMSQAKDTAAAAKFCAQTKNPQKCQAAIQRKVDKLKAKAAKIKG